MTASMLFMVYHFNLFHWCFLWGKNYENWTLYFRWWIFIEHFRKHIHWIVPCQRKTKRYCQRRSEFTCKITKNRSIDFHFDPTVLANPLHTVHQSIHVPFDFVNFQNWTLCLQPKYPRNLWLLIICVSFDYDFQLDRVATSSSVHRQNDGRRSPSFSSSSKRNLQSAYFLFIAASEIIYIV